MYIDKDGERQWGEKTGCSKTTVGHDPHYVDDPRYVCGVLGISAAWSRFRTVVAKAVPQWHNFTVSSPSGADLSWTYRPTKNKLYSQWADVPDYQPEQSFNSFVSLKTMSKESFTVDARE